MTDFPGQDSTEAVAVITEATNRMMVEQAKAEEDAIAAALCDVLDDFATSHNERLKPLCRDFFSDVPCDLDVMTVGELHDYADLLRYRRAE